MTDPRHDVRVESLRVHAISDPRKLALVVVDMQNLFLAAAQGADGSYAAGVVPAVNMLIDAVRSAGGTVVFTRQTASDEPGLASPKWFTDILGPDLAASMDSLRPGTSGHQLSAALHVASADIIVDKFRTSAFLADYAGLHECLRRRGIDTIIICGTVTNHCCQSTARDAYSLDYRVLFVTDATAALDDHTHNMTLADLRSMGFFDLRNTEDVVAEVTAG